MSNIKNGRIRRDERREDAAGRTAAYQALSIKDRIGLVAARIVAKGGQSKREFKRLTKLIPALDA